MTEFFSFARRELALRRAASLGTAAAAEILATSLREEGVAASVDAGLEGMVKVTLEGAGSIAREFGTMTDPARPVAGPALAANRTRMAEAIAKELSRAVAGNDS